jgi:CheY-like chemotaxis protein
MPVMSGIRATMQLRHMGFAKPIIALTANAQTEDHAEALAAGCDEFATKPIRRQQLSTLLTRFLPTWEPPLIVASPSPQTASTPFPAADGVQVAMGSPNNTSSVSSSSSSSSRMSPGQRKRSPLHNATKPITTTLTTSTSPVRNSPVLASPSPFDGVATNPPARRTGSDANDDIVLHIRAPQSVVSSSTLSGGGSTAMRVTSTPMTLPSSSQ